MSGTVLRARCRCALLRCLCAASGPDARSRRKPCWKARPFRGRQRRRSARWWRSIPDNADYRVRWGRMFLDHGQPGRRRRGPVQRSPGDQEGRRRRAARPGADRRRRISRPAPRSWPRKALEADPKLLEAQELLARLALEDNNNAKAADGSQEGAGDRPQFGRGQGHPGHHRLAGGQEGYAPGIRTTATRLRDHRPLLHAEPALRRRHRSITARPSQLDPDAVQRALAAGHQPDAPGPERRSATQQLETVLQQRLSRTPPPRTSLKLLDSYKNFVDVQDAHHRSEAGQEGSRPAAPLLRGGDASAPSPPTRRSTSCKLDQPGAGGSLSQPRGFRRPHPGHARAWARWASRSAYVGRHGQPLRPHAGQLPLGQHPVARDEPRVHAHHDRFATCRAGSPKAWRCTRRPPPRRSGATAWTPTSSRPSRTRSCCRWPSWIAASSIPPIPAQVIVSYFQAGQICDYITEKWGWDTLLAMLHDFADERRHADVIQQGTEDEAGGVRQAVPGHGGSRDQEDASTASTSGRSDVKLIAAAGQGEGLRRRDQAWARRSATSIPDYVEAGSVYEFLAAGLPRQGRQGRPPSPSWSATCKIGGRNPATLKQLAKLLRRRPATRRKPPRCSTA